MKAMFHKLVKGVVLLHDFVMAGASFLLALLLRFNLSPERMDNPWYEACAVAFAGLALCMFSLFRLYRGLWRFASIPDLLSIFKASTITVVLFYSGLFLFSRLEDIPRSVPVLHFILLPLMIGGPRLGYRILKARVLGMRVQLCEKERVPLLLIGMNSHTEHFLREMRHNPSARYKVVSILANDRSLNRSNIFGVPIYADYEVLPQVIGKAIRKGMKPHKVVLADNELSGEWVERFLEEAAALGITLARMPRLTEFRAGATQGLELQPVAVEDLLGRAQHAHDKAALQTMLSGKRVLVTGAGGSIGSELVRQVAGCAPSELWLFDCSEFNLYQIDRELQEAGASFPCHAVLGDVRDVSALHALFSRAKPELVFHAAAIKHVPLSEANPIEAVLTNVIGTRHVADACLAHNVQAMVMISTDKAVNPANVMGASKRLAECYIQALAETMPEHGTRFMTVRFGNVLGSAGSVVPLFQKQLQAGGPLTVTHPDMVRYFMTIREAVELVLQAATIGLSRAEMRKGLIFVVDMGRPVRIVELAEQMIRLSGKRPYQDVGIEFVGLRPGEKLYEELFHSGESSLKTDSEGIMIAVSRKQEWEQVAPLVERLYAACIARNEQGVFQLLHQLVPEYTSLESGEGTPDVGTAIDERTN